MTQRYNIPQPNRYLDTRVSTASQAELPLMMLDGALRFGRQARQFWDQPAHQAEIDRLLGRASDVVEELIRGVSSASTEISSRLCDEYAFAFRRLVAAKFDRDVSALDQALELLAYHRETWRMVCDNLKPQPAAPLDAPGANIAPPIVDSYPAGGNISLEA